MTEPTNEERADRAYNALAAYVEGSIEQPDVSCLLDLLTDSMHLFGFDEVNKAFRLAGIHYHAEINEDEESE